MIKAILFDFDGVIVDSERIHMQTFAEILSLDVPENRWYKEFAGTGSRRIIVKLMEEHSLKGNPDELVEKRRALFRQYLEKIQPVPGLKEFLESTPQKKAIVSGGHRSYIEVLLDMLEIREFFGFILSAEDTPYRKPDPKPFLMAAEALGVKPEECLVIEDSYSGCEGARRAGMKLAWLRPHPSMNPPDCDLVINDFTDPKLKKLL